MDTSTDTTTQAINKRTRFSDANDSDSSQAKDTKPDTPKKLLFALIRGSLASLPADLKEIHEKTSFGYMKILLKLQSKEAMLKKLNEIDSKITSSARIKFDIKGSKNARATEDFKQLETDTERIVEEIQKKLKQQIILVMQIEIKTLKKELVDNLCQSLRLISQVYCLDTGDDTTFSDVLAIHLI